MHEEVPMQSTADTIIAFNRCAIFITSGTTKQKEENRFPLLVASFISGEISDLGHQVVTDSSARITST